MESLVLLVLSCAQVQDLVKTLEEADHLRGDHRYRLIQRLKSKQCEPESTPPGTTGTAASLNLYFSPPQSSSVRLRESDKFEKIPYTSPQSDPARRESGRSDNIRFDFLRGTF